MNVAEIKEEIETLEQADTNWQNIQKLAWLYSVYDHLSGESIPAIKATAPVAGRVMPEYSGEFGEAISGKNTDSLMNILSEHMAVVKILYPKEYQAVLDRISEIPR